jgi:hypothetical protein
VERPLTRTALTEQAAFRRGHAGHKESFFAQSGINQSQNVRVIQLRPARYWFFGAICAEANTYDVSHAVPVDTDILQLHCSSP